MMRIWSMKATLIGSLFVGGVSLSQACLSQVEVTTLANFNGNGGITVHSNGDIYVSNFGDSTLSNGVEVTRLLADGTVEPFITLTRGLAGNDFDAQGNLIQAAFGSGNVYRVAPNGNLAILGQVAGPVGVVVSPNDTIFVTSCTNNNIQRFDGNNFVVHASHPGFSCPNGLTMDNDGNLYTLTFNTNNVYRIDPQGTVSLVADLPGGGGHLVYANGLIYVAGRSAHQIYAVNLDGSFEVLAGAGIDGNTDGPADTATLSRPNGIAVSNDGSKVYLNGTSDFSANGFNAIRQISLTGITGYLVDAAISGSWYDPTHDGEGFLIEVLDESTALVYWFTYNRNGRQRWFLGVGDIVDDEIIIDELIETEGPSFGPNYDPNDVIATVSGFLRIRLSTCTEGIADFEIDGAVGQLIIQRLTSIFTLGCTADP